MKFLATAYVLFASLTCFAQSPAPIVSPAAVVQGGAQYDANSIISQIVSDFSQGPAGKVGAAAGIVLLLVYVFRSYFLDKLGLGTGILPLVSILLGALMGFLSNVMLGVSAHDSAKIALLSGASASTLWSAVVKLFLPGDAPQKPGSGGA